MYIQVAGGDQVLAVGVLESAVQVTVTVVLSQNPLICWISLLS